MIFAVPSTGEFSVFQNPPSAQTSNPRYGEYLPSPTVLFNNVVNRLTDISRLEQV